MAIQPFGTKLVKSLPGFLLAAVQQSIFGGVGPKTGLKAKIVENSEALEKILLAIKKVEKPLHRENYNTRSRCIGLLTVSVGRYLSAESR